MKRLLFLISFLLLCLVYKGSAQCHTWQAVGNVDDTNQPSFGQSDFQAIAIDYNSPATPYVIYSDAMAGNKASVVAQSGSKWVYIGGEGFSGAGPVQYTTIQVGQQSGKVYSAYSDGNFSNKAIVMMLNGLSWNQLGSTPASSAQAQYLSLAVGHVSGNDSIYLAYADGAHSNKLSVVKYTSSGWVIVGTPGFSNGAVTSISLQYDNASSTPYIAYSDASTGNKVTVKKFTGATWTTIGSAGFTKKGASFLSMGLNLPNIYVAYIDSNGGGADSGVVMEYTGSWKPLGNAPSSYAFTPGPASDMSLTMDPSTPGYFYVSFSDGVTGGYATVMSHTGSGWNLFGPPDFSAGSVHNTGIVIDNKSAIHVVYQDLLADNKTTVMTSTGGPWTNLCTQGISGNAYAFNPSIAIDKKNKIVYTAFEDALNNTYNTSVMQSGFSGTWNFTGARDSVSDIYSRYPSIVVDKSGVPFVAYQDDNTGSFPFLKRFNGSYWKPLMGTGQIAATSISYIALAMDTINNIPYVVFDSATTYAYVKKFNGTNWVRVGASKVSTGSAYYTDIVVDTIAPYIVYADVNSGVKALVKRFNGLSWSTVGTGPISTGAAAYTSIAKDKAGNIYVAYQDNGLGASVQEYKSGTWHYLGSPNFTPTTSTFSKIIVDDLGNAYLAYIDGTANDRINVMEWNGSSWSIAGTANISQGAASGYIGMAIDGAGNPYVTYQDRGAVVKKFNACNSSGGPVVTITPANDTICKGNSTTLTASATGSGTITYTWAPATGLNTTIGSSVIASPTSTKTYTVTATDSLGSGKDSVTVVVSPPFTFSITPTSASICKGKSVTLSASSISSPSYTWSPATALSATNIAVVTATPTLNITYTLTASVKGCVEKDSVKISIIPPPTITISTTPPPPICPGSSLKLTASGASTYLWSTSQSNASITVTPSTTTSYTVTGTTSAGCTGRDSVQVTVNPSMVIAYTSSDPTCFGIFNGSITISSVTGGTSPYSFSWSSGQTTSSISALSAGGYTLVVTDKTGCTDTTKITLIQPPAISVSPTVNNVSCFGGSDGSIILSVTGGTLPYTFSWSSGPITSNITGLSAGSYSYTITDANGCTDKGSLTVTEPTQLRDSVNSVTNETCFGGNNGSAIAAVKGGTPGYTYSWSDGESVQNATSLTAGNYTVTVTDKAGCTAKAVVTITEPSQIRDSVSSRVNELCFGDNIGKATFGVKGGTPGYTYSWSPLVSSGPSATGLSAGTYSLTITDKNGCKTSDTVNIAQPALLVASSSSVLACTSGTLTTTINPGGGTAPYTYSWSPTGGNTATASGLSSGFYICTVTDKNGCKDTAGANVSIYSTPALSDYASNNPICPGTSTTLGDTIVGGSSPYTFSWSPTTGLSCSTCRFPIATLAATATYTLTVTDACGNKVSNNITITVNPAPSVTLCCDSTIFTGQSVSLSATVSGSGNTFTWSPTTGLSCNTCPNPVATPSVTTTYFVTVSNPSDPCSITDSVVIQIGSTTLIFYTGISPNGDGHNDTWIIDNIDAYPNNTAIIYNRWGTEVWKGTNYNNTSVVWKGYNEQGQPLPDGTYFYAVTINSKVYKGWVQLTR